MKSHELLRIVLTCLALVISAQPLLAKDPVRVPTGAKTQRAAAEQFFKAHKAYGGKAAADGPVKELLVTRGAGSNPSLQLIDDTHILYNARNDFLHGNPVSVKTAFLGPSTRDALSIQVAPLIFSAALEAFLSPPESRKKRDLQDIIRAIPLEHALLGTREQRKRRRGWVHVFA